MKTTDEAIVVEQTFAISKKRLWQALTDPAEMKKWFFDVMPDFKAEVGFETRFDISNEGRLFPHIWKVVSVVNMESIGVNWTFGGYPGSSLVTFALTEEGEKTKLTLTATVQEDFPDDIPEFKRESAVGGWNYFVKEALPKYFKNNPLFH